MNRVQTAAAALSPSAACTAVVLVGWLFLALCGGFIVDSHALAVDLARVWCAPSPERLLGCDELGRDVAGRLVLGARPALTVALVGAGGAIMIGGGLGILAGLREGAAAGVVHHLTEVSLAFPRLMLALAMGVLLTPGVPAVAAAFTLAAWPTVARPTRALVVSLRRQDFARAAAALGGSTTHILRRHILPHLWTSWLARSGGLAAQAVLLETAISFLGLGVQEPQPSWGGMIRDGLPMLRQAPAAAAAAGAAIFLTALAANLSADHLARRLDPRRRG